MAQKRLAAQFVGLVEAGAAGDAGRVLDRAYGDLELPAGRGDLAELENRRPRHGDPRHVAIAARRLGLRPSPG